MLNSSTYYYSFYLHGVIRNPEPNPCECFVCEKGLEANADSYDAWTNAKTYKLCAECGGRGLNHISIDLEKKIFSFGCISTISNKGDKSSKVQDYKSMVESAEKMCERIKA